MNRIQSLRIFSLFFLLILSGFVNAQNSRYDDWKNHYNKGIAAIDTEDFETALSSLEKAYEISESFTDKYIEAMNDTQFYLGKTYASLKRYDESLSILEQSLVIIEKIKGKTDKDFLDRSLYVASIFQLNKDYVRAIFYQKKLLDAMEAKGMEESLKYADILNNIGNLHKKNQDYDEAIASLNQSLEIVERVTGKNHIEYGITLTTLSAIYRDKGDYDKALLIINEALHIIEDAVGKQDQEYSNAITALVHIYTEIGAYDDAIKIQKEQLKKFDSVGRTTQNYASALFAIARLYHKVGDYREELVLLEQVKAVLGDSYEDIPSISNTFGQAHERLGEYDKALSYTLISIKKTSVHDKDYGTRIQNLAYIYTEMGEFKKALDAYDKALSSMERSKGKAHDKYGKLLNNIGKLQFQMGNYEKAKQLFSEALTNLLNNFDENHADYGYYLKDYAKTLLQLGQHEEAINLMKTNLEIAEKNSSTENEAYYNRQYELAKAYNSLGRFEEALPLLQNASESLKLKLGNDHADYGKMIKSLGDSYVGTGNLEKSFPLMVTSNEVNYKELNKIFKFRSENEKKSFLKVISKSFDDLQSIPLAQSSNVDKWNDLNLNNQLMLKGLLLNNSKDVLTQLATLNDSTIENSIKNYKLLKRQLAKTMSQSADKRTVNIDSLKEVVNGEEAKLVKLHSTKFGETMSLGRDWKESQAKLPKNAVAIEFSNFRVTTNGKPSDSMLYVAYVYNANSEHPELVKLFEEQQLKKVLRRTSPNKLYTSNDLYQLIWNPLEKHIKGYKTFYFSPSGLLNQIQFAAILKTDASTLGTQYNIVQLSNTAILAAQPTEPSAESTLFIGGIAYDYTDAILKSSDSLEYAFLDNELLKNTNATTSRGESFTFLPGSLSEINSLQNIIKSNGKSFKVLTDKEATETNFKKLSGNSPNILHIATHGYFYENLEGGNLPNYHLSTEDQYRLAEDPLLRSGLILAGGNYTWKHGSNPYEEEDGILTAMEISNLDLSNTQMVVLSACETGLGDIDGSEGVYGLQRAFKMAGVDIIVMSLWQVPDAETAEFMNLFYGNWMKSSKVRTAFSDAQRTMQKKYADEPLKWAAFVLFE